jgi:hypothetical protein
MTEAVLWFCTAEAIVNRAWSVGHDGVYDVLVSAVISLVLNSLCTSYGAHMDLASFTRLDSNGDEDDEERDPFAHAINAARERVAEHGGHGSQTEFWFNKHNFPHSNVMLPRYDEVVSCGGGGVGWWRWVVALIGSTPHR